MDENIQLQKQADLNNLTQQLKAYQQTYHNRPLQIQHLHTYLEFTKFVSQLPPTILNHYHALLTQTETQTLTNNITHLYHDLFAKIKNLAQRADQKENSGLAQNQKTEVCRVCLKELRTIEVLKAKE